MNAAGIAIGLIVGLFLLFGIGVGVWLAARRLLRGSTLPDNVANGIATMLSVACVLAIMAFWGVRTYGSWHEERAAAAEDQRIAQQQVAGWQAHSDGSDAASEVLQAAVRNVCAGVAMRDAPAHSNAPRQHTIQIVHVAGPEAPGAIFSDIIPMSGSRPPPNGQTPSDLSEPPELVMCVSTRVVGAAQECHYLDGQTMFLVPTATEFLIREAATAEIVATTTRRSRSEGCPLAIRESESSADFTSYDRLDSDEVHEWVDNYTHPQPGCSSSYRAEWRALHAGGRTVMTYAEIQAFLSRLPVTCWAIRAAAEAELPAALNSPSGTAYAPHE